MRNLYDIRILILFFTLHIFFWTGCTPKDVALGPNFSAIDSHTRRIAIVTPELRSFEISGGGIPECRVDWSRSAARNLSMTLKEELKNKQFEGILISEKENNFDLDTIRSFVQLNAYAIQSHLYGEYYFKPQLDTFDYSIGSLAGLCKEITADAIVFIFGSNEKFSRQRVETLQKMARVKTARSALGGTLSMILTGYGSFRTYQIPKERTWLYCVVADRQGRIIWYEQCHKADGSDLLKVNDARMFAKTIINGLRLKVE